MCLINCVCIYDRGPHLDLQHILSDQKDPSASPVLQKAAMYQSGILSVEELLPISKWHPQHQCSAIVGIVRVRVLVGVRGSLGW